VQPPQSSLRGALATKQSSLSRPRILPLFTFRASRAPDCFAIGGAIGIGGSLAASPLPHHRTYGSVSGGSLVRRWWIFFCTSAEGVGHGVRRTGCGSFERRRPGFTLCRRSKASYLVFGRLAGSRSPYLRVLPAFRPSAKLVPPTMPSADFCAAVRPPCDDLSPEGHSADLPR
jgi:hypothetical protein